MSWTTIKAALAKKGVLAAIATILAAATGGAVTLSPDLQHALSTLFTAF